MQLSEITIQTMSKTCNAENTFSTPTEVKPSELHTPTRSDAEHVVPQLHMQTDLYYTPILMYLVGHMDERRQKAPHRQRQTTPMASCCCTLQSCLRGNLLLPDIDPAGSVQADSKSRGGSHLCKGKRQCALTAS